MSLTSKVAAALTATVLAAGSLTACSSILNPGGGADAVTVYSNSLSDGRAEWLEEQAKKEGFTLQLVDIGGGDLYNRLTAEKDSPVADVTFGLNDVFFQKLVADDVLEPYKPEWADKLPEGTADPSGTYYPIVREPIMLVCNTAALPTEAERPADWPDLWEKEAFHGRYEVPASLGGATVQMVIAGIMSRHLDPSGKLGVSEDGWNAIKEWYTNGRRAEEGTDLYAQMANGNVACGQMWLAGKVTREKQYDITSEAAHPATGVPMVRQSIALIKGTKNEEGAKKFIDWFGSAKIQAAWSKEFSTVPMNTDALAEGNRDAIDYTDTFTEQDIDWKFVADKIDSWVEEIQLNYVK